ncbi:UNKNOWN [Stylonychia lemnae]|uniref:Uncharacterized protein n=1 Tax=Stylonychia lemnae TaxID=5949 RepID=A0A078AGQ5_STYLE|nr:UNKNOWN [Stylonychia lemnae]|eukprot:CDW80717.1 UNKNOWN [Stylonychia lemnae]
MEVNSKRRRESMQNLEELFKKDDEDVHLLFPNDIKRHRKNKLTHIAIQIKKRFSVDEHLPDNISCQSNPTKLDKESNLHEGRYDLFNEKRIQRISQERTPVIKDQLRYTTILPKVSSVRCIKVDQFEDQLMRTYKKSSNDNQNNEQSPVNRGPNDQHQFQTFEARMSQGDIQRLQAAEVDLSPSKRPPLRKTHSNKLIQDFIQSYKYKLGIKDHAKVDFEISQLNNKVKQWKLKRGKLRPMKIEELGVQDVNLNTQSTSAPTQTSSQNEEKMSALKKKRKLRFLQKVAETQQQDQSFSQQMNQAVKIDLIKIPKFQSHNVSLVSNDSNSRNVSPQKVQSEYPKVIVEDFNQNDQKFFDRLSDEGQLNNHTLTLKQTSVHELDDFQIQIPKMPTQIEKTPQASPLKSNFSIQVRETLNSSNSKPQKNFFPIKQSGSVLQFQKD